MKLKNLGLYLIGKRATPFGDDAVQTQDIQSTANEEIYSAMAAGCFKIANEGDPERTAYWYAREALDSDNVSICTAIDGGQMFYLAIPSSATSSSGRFKTPLTAALPTHPDHKGSGAYTLRFAENNFAVAILKTEDSIRIIANEIIPVFESIEDAGLDVFDCVDKTPVEMVSLRLAAAESAANVGRVIGSIAMILLTVSALLYVVFNGVIGWTGSTVLKRIEAREQQMEKVMTEVDLVSPLSRNLSNLSKITASASRAGGWIKTYQIDEKGNEYFEVELPEWVSRDYIDALGTGVKVDIDRVRRILIATKGVKKTAGAK